MPEKGRRTFSYEEMGIDNSPQGFPRVGPIEQDDQYSNLASFEVTTSLDTYEVVWFQPHGELLGVWDSAGDRMDGGEPPHYQDWSDDPELAEVVSNLSAYIRA